MGLLKYIIGNIIFAAAVWCATIEGVHGMENVVIFVVMMMGLLACFIPFLAPKDYPPRSVPHWVDLSYDFAIVLVFVYHGWAWTSVVYTWQMLMLVVVQIRREDYAKEQATKAEGGTEV